MGNEEVLIEENSVDNMLEQMFIENLLKELWDARILAEHDDKFTDDMIEETLNYNL